MSDEIEENEDDFVECCRCETKEHVDDMLSTDMGYLCENCEGDLR
jgi:3,4-dihydroxy-2-butanone 4-phosphate synthase